MEMRRSLNSTKKSNHSGVEHSAGEISAVAYAPLSRALSGTGLLLTAGTLAISLGLFFLLPRLSAGYLSSYSPRNEFVSGFSESVQLGEIGLIQQSNVVVMHIELEQSGGTFAGPPAVPQDLKWRGVALTHFDGRLWSNPPDQTMEVASGNGGRFDLLHTERQREKILTSSEGQRFRPLRYRVVMEPVGANVLFLAPVAASLQARIRQVGIDSNGSVLNLDRRMTESYEATSLLPQVTPRLLRSRSGNVPPDVAAAYTQLPEHLDPRVRQLAQRITQDASTDYDKAVAVEQYLSANYGYSLQMAITPPADPLAYFLFERKQGHCEYFASAMALLLRTVGIPSRIVNGFRAGEYNDLTGKYIIRGRDAHSWVEAYLPAYGWATFDPTPPDPQGSADGWSRLLLYLDAGREFWREWVINYDFLHQRTLTTSASRKSLQAVEEARLWSRRQYRSLVQRARSMQQSVADAPLRWSMLGMVGAGMALLLLNLPRLIRGLRKSRLARNPARAPQAAASIWYERMVRALERRGVRKLPEQTPAEFVEAIFEPELRGSVAAFTQEYEQARFGNSPEHAQHLPRLYEEIVGAKR
jgi:transglutaminase-like putative cysteine protease